MASSWLVRTVKCLRGRAASGGCFAFQMTDVVEESKHGEFIIREPLAVVEAGSEVGLEDGLQIRLRDSGTERFVRQHKLHSHLPIQEGKERKEGEDSSRTSWVGRGCLESLKERESVHTHEVGGAN